MSTAHRPTWRAATGGEEQGGMRFYAPSKMRSVKDQTGHTKIKYRQEGQNSLEELKRKDLKAVLEEKEQKALQKSSKEDFLAEKEEDLKLLEADLQNNTNTTAPLVPKAIDADIIGDEDESDSDDSDEDDDEAELLAELARIKKEREEEAARKAVEEAAAVEKAERQEMMHGNPLLQEKLAGSSGGEASFTMKKRWDDDVVFKNQARNEPKQQRRFINDTLRSDFHKRFLERYVK